jgi:hypothetical protein
MPQCLPLLHDGCDAGRRPRAALHDRRRTRTAAVSTRLAHNDSPNHGRRNSKSRCRVRLLQLLLVVLLVLLVHLQLLLVVRGASVTSDRRHNAHRHRRHRGLDQR